MHFVLRDSSEVCSLRSGRFDQRAMTSARPVIFGDALAESGRGQEPAKSLIATFSTASTHCRPKAAVLKRAAEGAGWGHAQHEQNVDLGDRAGETGFPRYVLLPAVTRSQNPAVLPKGPLYLQIVEALASDIRRGRLTRGQGLPTRRALAKALGVDLTTVTRAYAEARRRGLTEARVGRGTFVAEAIGEARLPAVALTDIDLSMNLPPQPAEADIEGRIARGIAALSREVGLARYLTYRPVAGTADERAVASAWMRARLPGIDAERLVISGGTQAALTALLGQLTRRGDVVLTEALTYPGFRAAAALLGVELIGVAMDRHGVVPDALVARSAGTSRSLSISRRRSTIRRRRP